MENPFSSNTDLNDQISHRHPHGLQTQMLHLQHQIAEMKFQLHQQQKPNPLLSYQVPKTLFVLMSLGLCCLNVANNLSDYLSFDTITNLKSQTHDEMTFPAVVFCGWYSEFPIDTAIVYCKFMQRDCQLSGGFEKVAVIGSGLSSKRYCVRFNGNTPGNRHRLASVNKTGYDYGLEISFLVPKEVIMYYGVYDNSQLVRSDEVVSLAGPGEGRIIKVKKRATNRLGRPYNECDDEARSSLSTELTRRVALMGSEYRQKFCFRVCLLAYMERNCVCSLGGQLDEAGANDTCSLGCVEPVWRNFDFKRNCGEECPLECDSVVFELEVEKEKISEAFFIRTIIETELNKTGNRLAGNQSADASFWSTVIFFGINFDSLMTEVVSELPKTTFTNFLSELGGTIGRLLFLTDFKIE